MPKTRKTTRSVGRVRRNRKGARTRVRRRRAAWPVSPSSSALPIRSCLSARPSPMLSPRPRAGVQGGQTPLATRGYPGPPIKSGVTNVRRPSSGRVHLLELGRLGLQLVEQLVGRLLAADEVLRLAHHVPVPLGEPDDRRDVAGGGGLELLGRDVHVLPLRERGLDLRALDHFFMRRAEPELERPAGGDVVLAVL